MRRTLLLTVLILGLCFKLFSQSEKFQAVYIYNFISKFVEWPASAKSGDFVIGVLGNSAIVGELNTIASSKTVGSQKIVVKKFESVGDVSNCHVLFVTSSKSGDIGAAAGKGGNVLIISDKENGTKKGSAINFVLVDNKQKFELNKANATSKGLKVSAELEKLAIIVN